MSDKLILKAARFSKAAHQGQVRKRTGLPYCQHPARVASRMMLREDSTPAMVAACFLHDTLEDTDTTFEVLETEFGSEVANLVLELTDVYKKVDYPKLNRASRHALELERIKTVSQSAKIIKLLDRIDNLRDHPPDDFLTVYLKESKKLLEVVKDGDLELAQELQSLIENLEKCRPNN